MNTTRRQFLQSTTGLALGWLGASALAAGSDPQKSRPRQIRVGLQLYAVRGAFTKDVPGTLKAIAAADYEGVEFWGYGGTEKVFRDYSARQLRHLLDEHGLKCCGMHVQVKALEPDRLAHTIEVNQILGNRYLIVAAAQDRMKSPETIRQFAGWLGDRAQAARKEKMRVGYHAHPFDFVKFDGRFAWDLLFSQTSRRVLMQMDVGNCLAGHGDPIAMLRKFPGRTPTIHIKDYEDKTLESDYYRTVFKLCETTARTRWYIVEMGGPGGNDLDIPRQVQKRLRRLGK
jgi:sugar phosphate isomerase/epimerase